MIPSDQLTTLSRENTGRTRYDFGLVWQENSGRNLVSMSNRRRDG